MDDEERVKELDSEFDNENFWKECDERLIALHGEKAHRWLTMLEDPDPDDLIFVYMRIVKTHAFEIGYEKASLDTILSIKRQFDLEAKIGD